MVKCHKKGYFRPQFVREQWEDLNGEWKFVFDDENAGERERYFCAFPKSVKKICVPYSYETPASGISDETAHETVWYQRTFSAKRLPADKRYLIHFEGADYSTKIWVNGSLAALHEGGNCRFTVDATDFLSDDGNNVLTVRCEDSFDTRQPRGKQRWLKNSFGCWYVQTTGIWKPVWSEIVSSARLDRVKFTPDVDRESVRIDYEFPKEALGAEIETEITFGDIPVIKSRLSVNRRSVTQILDMRCDAFDFKVKQWNPANPNLYDVKFTVFQNGEKTDEVCSYFGMRKIQADKKGIRLNNSPVYLKMILAQNYWKQSGYTMPDEDAAIRDISLAQEAGFNSLRIHQKIEDERFLFYCDVMGMFVWGEFPAGYEFDDVAVKRLTTEWMDAVRQQYNHPAIIAWVPFNESWGIPDVFTDKLQQQFTRGIYSLTKVFDAMRPVITNDGWEHTTSDILTLHDYDGSGASMTKRYADGLKEILANRVAHGNFKFAFAQGYSYAEQPIIVSEYGGIALASSEGWGYNGKVKNETELIQKYEELTSAIKAMPNVSGYCYTQLTDTYQEVNGLLDFEHNPKVDLKKIYAINEK